MILEEPLMPEGARIRRRMCNSLIRRLIRGLMRIWATENLLRLGYNYLGIGIGNFRFSWFEVVGSRRLWEVGGEWWEIQQFEAMLIAKHFCLHRGNKDGLSMEIHNCLQPSAWHLGKRILSSYWYSSQIPLSRYYTIYSMDIYYIIPNSQWKPLESCNQLIIYIYIYIFCFSIFKFFFFKVNAKFFLQSI